MSGWRVPMIDELRSIVDINQSDPSIDTGYFPSTQSAYYRSSSLHPTSAEQDGSRAGWVLYFGSGISYALHRNDNRAVRLVHGGNFSEPQANFSITPSSGLAPLTIAVDATTSSTTDGTITGYRWTSSDWQNPDGVTASFTFDSAGSYTVTLTVTDDNGATGSKSQTVTVQDSQSPTNQSPAASITASVTSGEAPLTVSFDGAASSDSDGSIASYSWTTSDGQSATGSTASLTFSTAGSYTVTLTVIDDDGATALITESIVVTEPANVSPTASITAAPTNGTAPLTVALDGSGSTDSDGTLSSYSWATSDGQSATGSTASLQFTTAGSYTVTLTVTDDDGATGAATETITVTEPVNLPPTALITATPDSGTAPLTVALDGSGSTDSDGSLSSYSWSTSDGQSATGSTASLEFTAAGSYTVILAVTDDDGAAGNATETITVTELANQPPTALITTTPDSGTAPLTVVLDGSGSTDSDGGISSYSWSTSDGQSATGSTASLQFTTAGSYTVTLTVTDDDGAAGTATETISVTEPANQPPTALFTATPNSGTAPLTVVLDASTSTDSDGAISSYRWSTSDGQTATGVASSLTFNSAGDYLITLVVTDDDGATSTTTTTVTAADLHMPVAAFTATPMIGPVPLTVTLDGSGSTTPNGSIVAYQWNSSGGQSANSVSAALTFDEVGSYTITHTVVDSSGMTGSSAQEITVTDALVATISATPTSGVAPLTVALDGRGSTTPNNSIVAYQWNSSDGQVAIGSRASFTYDSAGDYTITLTIIDDGGDTATATEAITVQEETASLGYNPTARPSPQVIAGGISPSQIDLNDTELDIMAIVRP
ncbi:MAG: PKD domain-containing protein, partial [Gammaproteobacteria bacterium]|nr:PKD domain-containing protein [Gammaproteobacteria bacterium]